VNNRNDNLKPPNYQPTANPQTKTKINAPSAPPTKTTKTTNYTAPKRQNRTKNDALRTNNHAACRAMVLHKPNAGVTGAEPKAKRPR